jgi:hypothetical protein
VTASPASALIFLASASGVSPVNTSPALLIADQVPPSALKLRT